MKKNFFKKANVALGLLIATVLTVSSCDTDPITDSNAGEFKLKNLRTNVYQHLGYPIVVHKGDTATVNIGNSDTSIRIGDTLLISFIPKNQYSNLHFNVEYYCDNTKIEDSLFTKNLKTGEHNLLMKASYYDSEYHLSEEKEHTFEVLRKN